MEFLAVENTVLVLCVILLLGIIVPELFRRLKLPFLTTLILLGAVLGPFGFDYIQMTDTIVFFGLLGSAFLMLMAGLETKLEDVRGVRWNIAVLVLFNGLIPFGAGYGITYLFGYPLQTCFLVATLFISSSVAIIIPVIKSIRFADAQVKREIITAIIIMDVLSLVLLAAVFQTVSPITQFPLPIYFVILLGSVIVLKLFLPSITHYLFSKRLKSHRDEAQLRYLIAVLLGVLLYFSGLGVHPILAAFLVGIILADEITSEVLLAKIHTIGYGLFVPVFFFVVGMEMDITMLTGIDPRDVLLVSIVAGLFFSKLISGYIGGRLARLNNRNSLVFGFASTIQLTTTLAAAYAGSSLGLLDTALLTAMIVLAIFTTIVVPFVLQIFNR